MPPPRQSLRHVLRIRLPHRPVFRGPISRFQHAEQHPNRQWDTPPMQTLPPMSADPTSAELVVPKREPQHSEEHYNPTTWLLPIAPPTPSGMKRIKVYPAPASAAKRCREPLKAVAASQILGLDPNGARSRLFAKDNPDAVHVGDIVLVRQRDGDPFSGVVMVIRRAGADSGILLRAQLTRVGVEMWFKIYSPTVTGIEIVQRTRKRKRRARLFYLRKPKHDVGSVEGVVRQYLKQRAVLGTTTGRRDSRAAGQRKGAKKGKK